MKIFTMSCRAESRHLSSPNAFILRLIVIMLLISSLVTAQTSRTAKVLRVIDGDTFVLTTGEKVRLLGVDTPELNSKDSREKLLAQQAALITKNFAEGKTIKLTSDKVSPSGRDLERGNIWAVDIFGRTLAYAWRINKEGKDSLFLQAELLKSGLARILMYDKKKMYYGLFYNLRNTARRNKLGIWSK